MHHHFASRFLIDTLHGHGFSCSYTEVQRYERNAAVTQCIDIPGFTSEHTMQYIADNVDHNLATVDGTGTFHGMHIITAVTPGTQAKKHIPKANVTAAYIAAVGRIIIRYFKIPPGGRRSNSTARCLMEELTTPSFSKTSMGWYDADVASWSKPSKGLRDVLTND